MTVSRDFFRLAVDPVTSPPQKNNAEPPPWVAREAAVGLRIGEADLHCGPEPLVLRDPPDPRPPIGGEERAWGRFRSVVCVCVGKGTVRIC